MVRRLFMCFILIIGVNKAEAFSGKRMERQRIDEFVRQWLQSVDKTERFVLFESAELREVNDLLKHEWNWRFDSSIIDTVNWTVTRRGDTSFSQEDYHYLLKQAEHYKALSWKRSRFTGVVIFTGRERRSLFKKGQGKEGWQLFKSKYGEGLVRISPPIFNVEGNLAIFSHSYTCGPLCGSGSIDLYERTEKGWILKKNLSQWIS